MECGAETTEAEKSAWANALRALVSRAQSQAPAPDETAGKGSRSAPAKPRKIPRLSALDLLTALDTQLEYTLGRGVAQFVPQGPALDTQPERLGSPVLILCSDEASSNLSLVHWLQWKKGVRLVHLRDPLHREWNDVTDAIRKAGLWSTVLLSSVVFNLAFGPWQGSAWWRKLQEGGAEYAAKAEVGDLLLDEFYEAICRDIGAEAYGDAAHKEEILQHATAGRLQQRKGERVTLSRWFSWMRAAQDHDALWHSRLLVITAIGLSLGLWKDAHAHPFFRHTAPTESRAVEGAQDDDGERKEAGKVVSETAGQAHTEDEPEAGGRKEAEHSLAELRRKARNTLFLAAEISAQPSIRDRCRMLERVTQPLSATHFQHEARLRSPAEHKEVYLKWAEKEYYKPLLEVGRVTQSVADLCHIGFDCLAGAPPPEGNHPEIEAENDLARTMMDYVLCLGRNRLASMAFYSKSYPGRLALMLSPSSAVQNAFLARMWEDFSAFHVYCMSYMVYGTYSMWDVRRFLRFPRILYVGCGKISPLSTYIVRRILYVVYDSISYIVCRIWYMVFCPRRFQATHRANYE